MAYLPRALEGCLREVAAQYPVVTITGPRQSGKSTLCRHVFPDKRYVNLELLDERAYAREDPRGFLRDIESGAVLDEAHHAPDLFSYLQVEVDERPTPGRFIVTGSQHFGLAQSVSQSLAGRTAVLHLLPFSWSELAASERAPGDLSTALWSGGYPPIFDREIPPDRWLSDYVTTYVQRDVRQLQNVTDLESFTQFVRLCAGRTACELNLSRLGSDAGVSNNTARAWLSVLEASFLCFRLPAWHRNVRKQLVKAPKLHFVDVGLAAALLGIRSPEDLTRHPLRGALFESWVAGEVYKNWMHRGRRPTLFHLRASRGPEIDLLVDEGTRIVGVESKSGATVASEWLNAAATARDFLAAHVDVEVQSVIVFGGDTGRGGTVRAVPWRSLGAEAWADPRPR